MLGRVERSLKGPVISFISVRWDPLICQGDELAQKAHANAQKKWQIAIGDVLQCVSNCCRRRAGHRDSVCANPITPPTPKPPSGPQGSIIVRTSRGALCAAMS